MNEEKEFRFEKKEYAEAIAKVLAVVAYTEDKKDLESGLGPSKIFEIIYMLGGIDTLVVHLPYRIVDATTIYISGKYKKGDYVFEILEEASQKVPEALKKLIVEDLLTKYRDNDEYIRAVLDTLTMLTISEYITIINHELSPEKAQEIQRQLEESLQQSSIVTL